MIYFSFFILFVFWYLFSKRCVFLAGQQDLFWSVSLALLVSGLLLSCACIIAFHYVEAVFGQLLFLLLLLLSGVD